MNKNEEYYYNKGITEGYFNVRLENIVDQNLETRKAFIEGYKIGKIKRSNVTEKQINKYEDNRTGYIKQIGFLVGYSNYPASGDNLNEKDKELFDLAKSAGIALKENQATTKKQKVRKPNS